MGKRSKPLRGRVTSYVKEGKHGPFWVGRADELPYEEGSVTFDSNAWQGEKDPVLGQEVIFCDVWSKDGWRADRVYPLTPETLHLLRKED
jgi:hypothetical protein